MNYYFPAAFILHSFSMTALMIILALAGNPGLAADIGLVHGITLALFYVFSANARNLLLNPHASISVRFLFIKRGMLVLPLGGVALYLSLLSDIGLVLALMLITRRCLEWLNEVFMSEAERNKNHEYAINFTIIQSVSLFALVIIFLAFGHLPWWALLIWAVSPLISCWQYLLDTLNQKKEASHVSWLQLLPHFGSTAIIGITVYVFRLFLVLLTGKETAGDLFSAFALGGFAGSLFANAIGPSIVLHEVRTGVKSLPKLFRWGVLALVPAGLALIVTTVYYPEFLLWTSKSAFFWQATGLSMIGGVIMVYAQRVRLRMIQQNEENDVFGPDVLSNILIIASIPLLIWLVSKEALTALYLISAIFSLMFYVSANKQGFLWQGFLGRWAEEIKTLITITLFFPIFYQLNSGIFRDKEYDYFSEGLLSQLPIPFSVIACYGGIILLGSYHRARIALSFIFFTFVLMTLTTIITTHGQLSEGQSKFIFLIQFILPMFALVLGQLYEGKDENPLLVEKSAFYVLAMIVPAQIITLWGQGYPVIYPNLYLFTIYQNLQYVCVIFIAFYIMILFSFWESEKHRKLVIISAPFIGIYAGASLSLLTTSFLIAGVAVFAIYYLVRTLDWKAVLISVLIASLSIGYVYYFKNYFSHKFGVVSNTPVTNTSSVEKTDIKHGESKLVLNNLSQRVYYWNYYFKQITSSTNTLLFGNPQRPERSKYPSAHNYYLDFIHGFGLLALAPMFILLGYTIFMIFKHYNKIIMSPPLVGLVITVLFLVLTDNSLKVGMRQPYPGIVTFFLWGVLLSRLFYPNEGRKVRHY